MSFMLYLYQQICYYEHNKILIHKCAANIVAAVVASGVYSRNALIWCRKF